LEIPCREKDMKTAEIRNVIYDDEGKKREKRINSYSCLGNPRSLSLHLGNFLPENFTEGVGSGNSYTSFII